MRRAPGGGGTFIYGWRMELQMEDGQGSAARCSNKYPLLITGASHHTHIYDKFWRKTTYV